MSGLLKGKAHKKTNSDNWWPEVLSIGKNTNCIGSYCL